MLRTRVKMNALFVLVLVLSVIVFVYELDNNYGIVSLALEVIFDQDKVRNYLYSQHVLPVPNHPMRFFELYRLNLDIYVRTIEGLFVHGSGLFQVVLPVFAAMSGALLYKKVNTICRFQYARIQSYTLFLFKEATWNALKMACSFYAAFLCFFFINYLYYTRFDTVSSQGTRPLLSDIIGDGLFQNHPFLYFLFEGVIRFFYMPFVYCFFANCVAFVSNKGWTAFLIPNLYYHGAGLLYYLLVTLFKTTLPVYITPSAIMASGTFQSFSTVMMLCTNAIPILIGVVLIVKVVKHYEI